MKKGDRIIVAVTFFGRAVTFFGRERQVMFMDVCVDKVSGDRICLRGARSPFGDYVTGKEVSVSDRGISWAFAHREKEVAALKVAATLIMQRDGT
jgi:hypothetical protein